MKLAEEILKELELLDWENMGNPQSDFRLWSTAAISKAIHRFITGEWTTTFIADGVFTNTTNFPTPPGTPVATPTVAVALTSMPPQFKGHNELYEAMKGWMCDGDLEQVYTDQFIRIFIDWLGVLKIPCGQDATIALPVVPSGTPNALPPYFHSIDGSTLPTNHPTYTYQQPPTNAYPENPPSSSGKTPTVDPNAQGAADGLDQVKATYDAPYDLTVAAIDQARTTWTSESKTEEQAQTDKTTLLASWKDGWEQDKDDMDALLIEASDLRKQGKDTEASAKSDQAKVKGESADTRDQEMLAKNPAPATDFVKSTYPDHLARKEAIEARRTWYDAKKSQGGAVVPVPPKVPLPGPHPDAPELESTILVPAPPTEQTWVDSPGYALANPVQVTWPNYELHAKALATEIQSLADASELSLETVWQTFAKHLILCLNDNVVTPGGGNGYCYGVPSNAWTGVVNGVVTWTET